MLEPRRLHPQQRARLTALNKLITAAKLKARAPDILALARPAVALKSRPAKKADLAPGATRLGGQPDLPPAFAWPEDEGEPLAFVAQVNLADLAPFDAERLLPAQGLLSFFFDPDRLEGGRVRLFPPSALLEARPLPAELEQHEHYTPRGVDLRGELSLPPPTRRLTFADRAEHQAYWDKVWLKLTRAAFPGWRKGKGMVHQMLGYEHMDTDAEQRPGESMLLQLGSDDGAGMSWGDAGNLYFFARDADLRKGQLQRARARPGIC